MKVFTAALIVRVRSWRQAGCLSPGTEVVKWNGCKLLSTTQQSEPMDQTYIKEHGEFKV